MNTSLLLLLFLIATGFAYSITDTANLILKSLRSLN